MKSENIETYLSDASNYLGNAEGVYSPKNVSEIQQIIKKCSDENILVTCQGARTGLTGSGIPEGGVVISSENLNKINFDEKTKKVICGAGVIHKDLDDFLSERGFFLPPNPTETLSMISGNVGTNASGSRTYKYGAIRNWVSALSLVLPSGEVLRLKRDDDSQKSVNGKINLKSDGGEEYEINVAGIGMPEIKHAAGYYLKKDMHAIDLFIGAEGTLGFIFEIELETWPLPSGVIGLIIFFSSSGGMLDFVESLQNGKDLSPRLIEYFGKNALGLLNKFYPQIPENSVGAIWVEEEISETGGEHNDKILEKWMELIENHSGLPNQTWMAQNEKEHRFFAEFRHKLPEEIYENLVGKNRQKIGTDCAVPRDKFRDYFHWLFSKLEEINMPYLVFGHIGNSHLHANLFYENDEQMKKAQSFYQELVTETIRVGGTVSAEHGIGKIKKEYLKQMFGQKNLEIMKNIKKIFDPQNIFGRGNLF
jgi:D-lactate dehydrogenase (cytochrome)